MSDKVDLDELARRYLDLWQDQMAALAADPEFAETMSRLVAAGANAPAAWQSVMAGMAPAGGTGAGGDGGSAEKHSGTGDGAAPCGGPAAASGAAPAAASPDHGGLDLEQLAVRLAALEERIAALESGAGRAVSPRPGGARRKPRKSGS